MNRELTDPRDIKSKTLPQLQEELAALGLPKYRAQQVYRWLHRGVTDFSQMSDLSRALREDLAQRYYIAWAQVERKRVSQDGTVKYLFRLPDGEHVESVLMHYHHGTSICISTQVGCKMNCSFCATGKSGFSRDLAPSEILSQVQEASLDLGERISHIVLMGMGEPLDNYQNVLRFLELVTSPEGMNIGMRHISLSTCGIVPQIDRLAEHKLQLTLSISLHAPNDAIRSQMMPVNDAYPVARLMEAVRRYQDVTGRRVSFEYSMVRGVNDSDACARELAHLIRGMGAHVNLIPINPVDGSPYSATDAENVRRFQAKLTALGVNATIRRRLGSEISAACGQLRREEMDAAKTT